MILAQVVNMPYLNAFSRQSTLPGNCSFNTFIEFLIYIRTVNTRNLNQHNVHSRDKFTDLSSSEAANSTFHICKILKIEFLFN